MRSIKAFSLLEMAIVLAIIGVIVGGGLTILTGATQANQFNATITRMERIDEALLQYTVAFGRLPCPANLTLAPTDTNYGMEAASNSNTCIGGTPAANFSSTAGTVEGAVPVRTLRLPDNYLYDSWGRKFRYAVDPAQTASKSFPPASGMQCTSVGAIKIKDATGAYRSTAAAYVLLSHGALGHGGYTKNGALYITGTTNTDKLANCHCTTAGVSGTYSSVYVQKLSTLNSASLQDSFDDLVSYREPWQMQSDVMQLNASTCNFYVWVVDYGNNRVQKFDAFGNYVTSAGSGYNGSSGAIGSCGYSAGRLCNPAGIAADSSGNIYVSSGSNIDKFDKTGTFVTQLASLSWGSGNGNEANGGIFSLDGSGNFWNADTQNNRLEEFNSSYSWVRSRGGPSPHSCETSPAGSVPACANGSGSGQYGTSVDSITVDTSGNIWVGDTSNHRIVKLDNTGAYVSQFPCASGICSTGSGSGYFAANIYGLRVDGSGNIYASDEGNARVQKFTGAGVFVNQFPCASGSCTNGTANGSFSSGSPDQLAIDPNGDVWAADYSNNRVQKFSSGVYKMQLGCGGSGSCSTSSTNGYFNSPEGIVTTTQ